MFGQYSTLTSDFSIIRLHGGDRKGIGERTGKVWDSIVAPQPDGVSAAAQIVTRNASRRAVTFVNVNNHYEGCAPLTIQRLLHELRP